MNDEFQERYAEVYEKAKLFVDSGNKKSESFRYFLKENIDMDKIEIDFLVARNIMHNKIGNNELFTGDGMTKNCIKNSPNQYGCPEFFSFDRKSITVKIYKENSALIYKKV